MRNELAQFEETVTCFVILIRSLPEDAFLEPMNGWSPRDVVAHLAGWNGLMITSCQDILQGQAPAYYADAANDYRNINAGFVARFSARDREALLAELIASRQSLVSYLQGLDPSEWQADHGVEHHRGGPATVAGVLASLEHDYQAHTRQIEAWLGSAKVDRVASPGS
jgi:hypothetical protein